VAITTGKQRTRRLEVQRALGRRRDSLVTEVAPGIKGCSEDLRREGGPTSASSMQIWVCGRDVHNECCTVGCLVGHSKCRYSLHV
jgi:hypothetical protein